MGNEQEPATLTAAQEEVAEFFLDVCGLRGVADRIIEVRGQFGTVKYGLGLCAERFADQTPAQVTEFVMAKLDQAGS